MAKASNPLHDEAGPGWPILAMLGLVLPGTLLVALRPDSVGVIAAVAVTVLLSIWWRATNARLARSRAALARAEQALADFPSIDATAPRQATTNVPLDERVRSWGQSAASLLREGQRSGAQLRGVLDSIEDPLVVFGPEESLSLCNRAATDLIGSSAATLQGRPLDEIFTQPDLHRLVAQAHTGQTVRGQVRFAQAEGERVYEAVCVPLREPELIPSSVAGSAPTVVLVLRDVTDLARSVQVRADFVANASHELRTPIATLRLCVETLQAGAKDDEPMRDRLLETMASQTGRLEEMIRDLLDLSKLESPEFKVHPVPVLLPPLLAAIETNFRAICEERRLTLRVDLAEALDRHLVVTDAALLGLVVQNLVDNATKFAYEGTDIDVSIDPLVSPGTDAQALDECGLRVIVRDRGIGIPLAHQSRIFERYYQIDEARSGLARGSLAGANRRRGSGLGLAIVKHAVKALGGTIDVSSVWKQGTTMTVDLPPLGPASLATLEPAPPLPPTAA